MPNSAGTPTTKQIFSSDREQGLYNLIKKSNVFSRAAGANPTKRIKIPQMKKN